MKPISVPLWSAKESTMDGYLDYRPASLISNQRRLVRRVALVPQIDLCAYSVQAVIDFIEVNIHFKRTTQAWFIRRIVDPVIHGSYFAHPINPGDGKEAVEFSIRIWDAKIDELIAACCALDAEIGLAIKPTLSALEVSVDFTPRAPGAAARTLVAKTLMHSFKPSRDVHEHPLDRPRAEFGKGNPDFLIYWTQRLAAWQVREYRMMSAKDRIAPIDGTFYAGAKDSQCFWRIMDKTRDEQNRFTGTARILPENERRARIEVSMTRPELELVGLRKIADLKDFSFATLQGSYFNFFLPTFHGPCDTTRELADAWTDQMRLEKFIGTGIIGLGLMEEARDEQRIELRAGHLEAIREAGLAAPPMSRVGSGNSGTMIAYTGMNRIVSKALERLGRRVSTSFERSARTFGDAWFMRA